MNEAAEEWAAYHRIRRKVLFENRGRFGEYDPDHPDEQKTSPLHNMRIAVSGAHRTGKTTLVEELGRALPTYEIVDEPYFLLEEEGHEFAAMPSLEDFELQLERSIDCLLSGERDQIFDRCPADILAYLLTHEDSDSFDVELWLPRVSNAMQHLHLIVYVPIENPDRVPVSAPDDELRVRVDEELRDILQEDRWGFGAEVLEVTGSLRERVRQVLAQMANQKKMSN